MTNEQKAFLAGQTPRPTIAEIEEADHSADRLAEACAILMEIDSDSAKRLGVNSLVELLSKLSDSEQDRRATLREQRFGSSDDE